MSNEFCNLVERFEVWLSRLGYQLSTVKGRKREVTSSLDALPTDEEVDA